MVGRRDSEEKRRRGSEDIDTGVGGRGKLDM
jgi:hypothetical protein